MTRTNRSARTAGTRFETQVADYLRRVLGDDRIERRARHGAKDTGDIAGVRFRGQRVVLECKNRSRVELAAWVDEAEIEAGNDDAWLGVVVHKRRGTQDPSEQYVTMELGTFAAMLAGGPDLLMGEDGDE